MLFVQTKVGPSAMQGLGLFADQFIPKGTVIWKFTPGFDQKFSENQIMQFPPHIHIFLARYAWLSRQSGLYCMASDNGKYFNHSRNPNTRSTYTDEDDEVVTTAMRDIQIGDEITDDYSNFEDPDDGDNCLIKIAHQYDLKEDLNYA